MAPASASGVACTYALRENTAMRDFHATLARCHTLQDDDEADTGSSSHNTNNNDSDGHAHDDTTTNQSTAESVKDDDASSCGSPAVAARVRVRDVWVHNRTGMRVRCRLERARSAAVEQNVANATKAHFVCARAFGNDDSDDDDDGDDADHHGSTQKPKAAATAQTMMSVWVGDNEAWKTVERIPLQTHGRFAVRLRNTLPAPSADDEGQLEDQEFHTLLVAEVALQDDQSTRITLRSQVSLENRTRVPIMAWAFAPVDNGTVSEWMLDQDQECSMPLNLVHAVGSLSVRPSRNVPFAPVFTVFDELKARIAKLKTNAQSTTTWIGDCVCVYQSSSSADTSSNNQKEQPKDNEDENDDEAADANGAIDAVRPLSGFVDRDLPPWRCRVEVEAVAVQVLKAPTPVPVTKTKKSKKTKEKPELVTMYRIVLYPALTIHNSLATPLAYRLLTERLQLLAEGVLVVGGQLPIYQVDTSAAVHVSFRVENYLWSPPKLLIHPKKPAHSLPFKASTDTIDLVGRSFEKATAVEWEQGSVPNLQLQLRTGGFDIAVSCPVWIINRSGMDLEYTSSSSASSKALKYVHTVAQTAMPLERRRASSAVSHEDDGIRVQAFADMQPTKVAATNPVAILVAISQARNLAKAHYFGSQSPYVRASLYVFKQHPKQKGPKMMLVDTMLTKPSPSGGCNPRWDRTLDNLVMLRIPDNTEHLDKATIILEVRSARYGMDTCLGATAVKVGSILNNSLDAASYNWYELTKRVKSKSNPTRLHRGDIKVSFSLGATQDVTVDSRAITGASVTSSSSNQPKERHVKSSTLEAIDAAFECDFDDDEETFHTPQSNQIERSLSDSASTSDSQSAEDGHPARVVTVYMPHNRFMSVQVEARRDNTLAQLFERVCSTTGLQGDLDPACFDFYELRLPRFTCQRTPGLPDGERWYGHHLDMHAPLGECGEQHGLYLCHRATLSTLRLYDQGSLPDSSHMLSKSMLATSKQVNPAQNQPVPWEEVLLYGPSAKHTNSLRLRARNSTWSPVLRLKPNTLGPHAAPEAITLKRQVDVSVPETQGTQTKDEELELALWCVVASGVHKDTVVVTIVPRYVVVNGTHAPLHVRPVGTDQLLVLSPNDSAVLHWADAAKDKLVQVALEGRLAWSDGFRIPTAGTSRISLTDVDASSKVKKTLFCCIERHNGSTALVLRDEEDGFV